MRTAIQLLFGCSIVLAPVGMLCGEQITSTCTITAADVAKNTVTLVRETPAGIKTGIAKVSTQAKITVEGQAVSLRSLTLPAQAEVIYETQQKALVVIRVLHNDAVTSSQVAAPMESAAAATRKAKIVYFTLSTGYEHSVVKRIGNRLSHSEEVLRDLCAKKNIEVVCSKDGGVFDGDMSQFDAFVFYTSGDLTKAAAAPNDKPMSLSAKNRLLAAIADGKPFVGIHAAAATFTSSVGSVNDYIAMVGGEFITHGAEQDAKLKIITPKFPGIDGLADIAFLEEWFTYKNFSKDLHVILAQDTSGMKGPMYQRPPYPATWAHRYGKGRVFYTSLGHREDVWTNPVFQQILLGGLSWALGREDADLTPNGDRITIGTHEGPEARQSPEPPRALAPFDAITAKQHQAAWAEYLHIPAEIANSIGMKMVLIPAGEFSMGSPALESDASQDEKPQHRVRISTPLYLGMHETTVGQFRTFVEEARYDAGTNWQTAFQAQTDEHPVVNVSWHDAVAFCGWLTKKEGKHYLLPTEAEWEYACRAGTETKWSFGDRTGDLGTYAWFDGNSRRRTHPVGQKQPNPWGLHDMHGNAWEWCRDWYDSSNYGASPIRDPNSLSGSSSRVDRGGGWISNAGRCRAASRDNRAPAFRNFAMGFRVCRAVE